MALKELLEEYLAGPHRLRQAVRGMSDAQLDAKPIPGKWSTRQVVAHLADFEPIYADRIKRILAEDRPTFFGGDPDVFAAGLAYEARNVQDEIAMIEAVRRHLARVLWALDRQRKEGEPCILEREGVHDSEGPMTAETLLTRITNHIPHHIRFIEEKRAALK